MAASGREGLSGARSWLLARDGGLRATRRAARTAIVMPALFAVGSQVIGNADVATFAAFGSFAMLLLADFGGTIGERLAAQSFLVAIGCVLIAPATLVSRTAWLAAVAMLVVGFVVLFAGVVSSALAGASTSILLSFILPVTTPAPASAIPDRLLGWLLAGVVSLPAVTLLWPAPRKEPLREAASDACRQLAARLDAEVAARHGEPGEDVDTAVARADAAVARLRDDVPRHAVPPVGSDDSGTRCHPARRRGGVAQRDPRQRRSRPREPCRPTPRCARSNARPASCSTTPARRCP